MNFWNGESRVEFAQTQPSRDKSHNKIQRIE